MSQATSAMAVIGVVVTCGAAAVARGGVEDDLRFVLQPGTAATQPPIPPPAGAEPVAQDAWFDVTARAWFMGVTGDVGTRGVTVDMDASFSDMWEQAGTVFGLSGRLE